MPLELIKPHTHAGLLLAPGARLDIDAATANWLIERGVAQEMAVTDTALKLAPAARKGD